MKRFVLAAVLVAGCSSSTATLDDPTQPQSVEGRLSAYTDQNPIAARVIRDGSRLDYVISFKVLARNTGLIPLEITKVTVEVQNRRKGIEMREVFNSSDGTSTAGMSYLAPKKVAKIPLELRSSLTDFSTVEEGIVQVLVEGKDETGHELLAVATTTVVFNRNDMPPGASGLILE